MWVEPDIRDNVISYVEQMKFRSGLSLRYFLQHLGIGKSKYYSWRTRQGTINNHNGSQPRYFWIKPDEQDAIIFFSRDKLSEGYRRLTYMMLDADIAWVSPSTTYRVLKQAGLLQRWSVPRQYPRSSGFTQPDGPNKHWHIDVSYINVRGSFLFLITILDGYSRKVIHHELRTQMQQYDVQITIQRALEKYPQAKPRLISDNGKQFKAKELKEYLRECGLKQVHTSPHYPQSNGKIERFHRTVKSEAVRQQSYLSIEDARRQIQAYIDYYNNVRLHSAIYYVTPEDMFTGKANSILQTRQQKLDKARINRKNYTLTQIA
jgi:putative transposase